MKFEAHIKDIKSEISKHINRRVFISHGVNYDRKESLRRQGVVF